MLIDDSPLLNQAMTEIKAVLDQYNLAGMVVVHTPGYSKYFLKLDPTYSCAKIDHAGRMHFKASLKDDFGGDKVALEERVKNTSEMLQTLVTVGANMIMPIGQLRNSIHKLLDQGDAVVKNIGDANK